MKKLLLLFSISFTYLNAMEEVIDPFTERVDSVLARPQSPQAFDHLVIHVEVKRPEGMSEEEWLTDLRKNVSEFQVLPCINGKETHVQVALERCDTGARLWAKLPRKLVGIIIAAKECVRDPQLLHELALEPENKRSFDFVAAPDSPLYQEANELYYRALKSLR